MPLKTDNPDQFFEFSKQYKEALVLAATQKVVDNKKMSQFDKDLIPSENMPILSHCKICKKVHTKTVNLKKHICDKHKFESFKKDTSSAPSSEEDNLKVHNSIFSTRSDFSRLQ